MKRVVVEAPATSANLGPGFDVFALALKRPRDMVEVTAEGSGPLKVELEVAGNSGISGLLQKNAAGVVIVAMARRHVLKGKISIRLTKGVPVGVGLGSSGASSTAAAVAMNHLFDLGLKDWELLQFAGMGEKAASGTAHLDNVTAALLGGFVLVPEASREPVSFKPPAGVRAVVVTPLVELPGRKTEYARSLLPTQVRLEQMTVNVSHASRMVAGFAKGDIGMIGEGMEDAVVEPARASIVPGLHKVKKAARESGAAGCCISGAGPSVLALVDSGTGDTDAVLAAIRKAFRSAGAKSVGFVTTVGEGAGVVESS